MRPAPLALLGSLVFLPALPARAAPPRHALQLVYVRGNGAAACPDEAVLRKELATVMHYDPVQAGAPQRLTAVVERRGAELTAIAILRDEKGHVVWETDLIATTSPCRVLIGALALAIDAWLGVPQGPAELPKAPQQPPVPQPAAPTPAPAPAPAPEPPKTPPPVAPSVAPTPAPRSVTGYGGMDAMAAFGVTPTPSLGAGFFAGVRLREPALFFESGARAGWTVAPSALVFPNGKHVPVRRAFLAATLAGCGAVGIAFFCVLGGGGSVSLTSDPYAGPATRSSFGLVGARIGIQHGLGEYITLRALGEFEALLRPETPRLNDSPDARIASPVMAALGLGVAFGP
jgi:hypothetical protein